MIVGETIISRLVVWVYYLFGQWPNENSSLLYYIFSFILHFGFVFLYLICMLINLIFITDVNETTHSLYVTLTELAFFLKVMNFFWFNRGMKECMSAVVGFELKSDDEAKWIRKRMHHFNWLTYAYYIIPNICAITASMRPLFIAQRDVPFRGWYPLDWVNSDSSYTLVYAYQVIGIMIEVNLNITLDVYPNYLMHMISIEMEILGKRLTNLGLSSNKVIRIIDPSDAYQRKGVSDLVDCIKTHQKIIRLFISPTDCIPSLVADKLFDRTEECSHFLA
ncbi:hypothetical protein HA402_005961 [Bradysia odoriphaga]|nr:hypothetical protein HA402_005961 [Bradysia odoriphaga]